MTRRVKVQFFLAAVLLAATGCAKSANIGGTPNCNSGGSGLNGTMVLMAQAVPSAEFLPCVRSMPVGWSFAGLDVSDRGAQFWLDSDRDGSRAVTVALLTKCGVGGAIKVPSEQPGMRRYERVTRVTSGYGGERYYVYPGGCTRYTFDLHGTTRAEPLAAISSSLAFLGRRALDREVREQTDGKLGLNRSNAPR